MIRPPLKVAPSPIFDWRFPLTHLRRWVHVSVDFDRVFFLFVWWTISRGFSFKKLKKNSTGRRFRVVGPIGSLQRVVAFFFFVFAKKYENKRRTTRSAGRRRSSGAAERRKTKEQRPPAKDGFSFVFSFLQRKRFPCSSWRKWRFFLFVFFSQSPIEIGTLGSIDRRL